jgi:hypothetical protein
VLLLLLLLLQVERDLQIIDELGLNLVQTINTHCHAGEYHSLWMQVGAWLAEPSSPEQSMPCNMECCSSSSHWHAFRMRLCLPSLKLAHDPGCGSLMTWCRFFISQVVLTQLCQYAC